ncbi:MAG: DUF4293 family protein [bacterium]|nr:DUF4293 family protein [bacterium]
MIQRRQTLFLIQLIFFGIALLFVPSLKVVSANTTVPVYLLPLSSDTFLATPGHIAAVVVNFSALLLSCIAIFLYKKRELQAKLCYVLMLLWLTITLMIELCPFVKLTESVTVVENTHFGTLIGIFGMLAAYLALHYIRKDIELLKSADRIR